MAHKARSHSRLGKLLPGLSRLQTALPHRAGLRWFLAAAAACGVSLLVQSAFAELRPGNGWGLWYGTLAALFMLGTVLLAVRRRAARLALKLGLGRSQAWLQYHLYGGTLSLLLMLMHSGFRLPHGVLGWWLWLLSWWVVASGFLGVLLQWWLPKLLTSGLAGEVVLERIPELIVEVRERALALAQSSAEPVQEFYRKHLAAALLTPQPRWIYYLDITGGVQSRLHRFRHLQGLLATAEQEKLQRLEALYKTKLELDAHYTLQRGLRWWLCLHLPPSLALLVLLMWHLFAVWYY